MHACCIAALVALAPRQSPRTPKPKPPPVLVIPAPPVHRRRSAQEVKERALAESTISEVPAPCPPRQGLPAGSTAYTRHVHALAVGPLSVAWARGDDAVGPHELLPALAIAWGAQDGTLPRRTAHELAFALLSSVERALTDGCWQLSHLLPVDGDGRRHPLLAPLVQTQDSLQAVCMPAVACRGLVGIKPHAQGYVQVAVGGGQLEYAHRIVTWLFLGAPEPSTRQSAHLCGHSNCLNPYHLSWAWPATNIVMAGWHAAGMRGVAYPFLNNRHVHPEEFEGADSKHQALLPGRQQLRKKRGSKRGPGRPSSKS